MGKVNVVEKDGKKYIDGEEVLCEYSLDVSYTKEILFLLLAIIFYMYMKSKNFDVNIVWWIFSLGIIMLIISGTIKDIKSSTVKKIYLTKEYFITDGEDKINLNEIYFRYKSYGYFGWRIWKEINFYKNNKFIFHTNIDENSEEYKNFIDTLIVISGNKDIAKELPRYYAKRKLIQTKGEKDGK
jgi:hypothetical protein